MGLLRREKLAERLGSADPAERLSAAKALSEREDIEVGEAEALVAALDHEADESVGGEMLRAVGLHLLNMRKKYEIERIYGRELGRKDLEKLQTLQSVATAMAVESAPDDLQHFSKEKRLRAAQVLAQADTIGMKAADALISAYESEQNTEIKNELLRALGGSEGGGGRLMRGGLDEPYCSERCYELGGQTITRELLSRWEGDCSVCRTPIRLQPGSRASMVCYRPGEFLYFCGDESCVAAVRRAVQADGCVVCGAPVT